MFRQKDFPKALKIKDAVYGVKFVRVFPPEAVEAHGDLDGYCCYESATIYVRRGQAPTDRLGTALHELLHALDVEWDVGLRHDQIYKLEKALVRLVADNVRVA